MLLKLWKLAARTFVLADGPGFVERALPGSEPGGVLSWLSDVYATLGLVDGLALPAAVLMAALASAAAPWRSGGWPVAAAGLATAALLGFSCHIVCRAVYDDFAVSLVRTTDFQCWWSWEDASDILASERALVEGDFARCVAVARGDAKPHRIVLARRILSLYRLGRFPAALGELPPMCIADEAEDPLSSADGYLLYFNYGLFGPARYWMEENGAHFGDQPIYLRYLGDIVLLGGEAELAKRYYRRYARCPFRAAEARERLAYCESPETARQFLMKNAALAKMARTWAEEGPRRRIPTFFTPTEQAELFIYECFYVLDEKAPAEMRMMSQVAARLLGREPPR